jgi:hypothetical protein
MCTRHLSVLTELGPKRGQREGKAGVHLLKEPGRSLRKALGQLAEVGAEDFSYPEGLHDGWKASVGAEGRERTDGGRSGKLAPR